MSNPNSALGLILMLSTITPGRESIYTKIFLTRRKSFLLALKISSFIRGLPRTRTLDNLCVGQVQLPLCEQTKVR